MIKLESLRTFVIVANAGNIADAAERIGRTPSAVSMALRQLEDDIGGALFETDRKNALTALGQFTLETAAAQIPGFDASVRAIRAFASNQIGRLSITSVPSVAANILPGCLQGFLAERPDVEVELLDADSRSVATMIDAGATELGIAGPPVQAARLSFTPLFSDRFRIVFDRSSPLWKIQRPLIWQDLHDVTFIRNEASDAIDLPELRAQYFRASMTVRNVTSLLAMVRAGVGVTLLPALATSNLPEGLAARDIDFRGCAREVGLISRKGRTLSPVAAAFSAHLQQEILNTATNLNISPIS